MAAPEEGYTVEEVELSDFDMGFITGVLAAWGIKEPSEAHLRDAMALLMEQARTVDGAEGSK